MSPTDKLPESHNAPASAAPAAPTEGGVSPEMLRERQLAGVDQRLAAVEQAASGSVEDKQAVVDQLTAVVEGTASTTATSTPDTTATVSGGWGALSGLSVFFTRISETFGDIGKKFSEWLKAMMGEKDSEGVDPYKDKDEDADANKGTDLSSPPPSVDTSRSVNPERIAEASEMLTPNAPVFSFAKTFDGIPRASDVPCIRPIHPATGKHNVPHPAVDIPAPVGTRFFATHAMTMLEPKVGHVKCRLDDGTGTVVEFLHVGKVGPYAAGERMPKGALIAETGNVGRSTGPHLDFRVNGGKTDPIPFLDPGLVESAEKKIAQKKKDGEWIPLESDEHEHGIV